MQGPWKRGPQVLTIQSSSKAVTHPSNMSHLQSTASTRKRIASGKSGTCKTFSCDRGFCCIWWMPFASFTVNLMSLLHQLLAGSLTELPPTPPLTPGPSDSTAQVPTAITVKIGSRVLAKSSDARKAHLSRAQTGHLAWAALTAMNRIVLRLKECHSLQPRNHDFRRTTMFTDHDDP